MYFKNEEVNLYRIYELYPRGELSGAGFSVFLNGEFANKIRNIKLSNFNTDFMMKTSSDILKRLGFYERQGLYFYEGTMLLHWCRVDGSACEIGVEGDVIGRDVYDRPLNYSPHNIDAPIQAYGLLSLWLHWFNYAEAAINLQQTNRLIQRAETRPDDSEPGEQISGLTVDGKQLPPCR